MSVKKISIENILSFENLVLENMKDLNCIVGRNNVGKSNLLKALKYFYNKLEGLDELPPSLNSNYSYKGSISIEYDITKMYRIARKQKESAFFKHFVSKLVPLHKRGIFNNIKYDRDHVEYTLTLNIYSDGKVRWSTADKQTLDLILYLYPFFYIEPRHMNLHQWDSLWDLISRLKSFNLSTLDNEQIIDFFDKSINKKGESSYRKYIDELNLKISTKNNSQKEKVLTYIKAGLKGQQFEIDENELKYHSDGTNSFHFIKTFLGILITVSKREYIKPFVFIDEPELGLHPKLNEILMQDIFATYNYPKKGRDKFERPKIFINTHSPNIVKEVIKKFGVNQRVYIFKKYSDLSTNFKQLNSYFDNESFINIYSDNEARLFFSDFILFVEGETELEVFGNMRMASHFSHLKNVDVYKCSNNKIGERINPSYSNSAIPYLFLFDADKAIEFEGNFDDFKIKLKKNGGYYDFYEKTLDQELKKYSLGFGIRNERAKENIKIIKSNSKSNFKVNRNKQVFHDELRYKYLFNAVKERLLQKNFYINETTLEGCLINYDSRKIFYRWLDFEHGVKIDLIVDRVNRSNYSSESMLIDFLRVIFNGKTSCLTDYSFFNLELHNKTLKNKNKLTGKISRTSKHAKVIMHILEKVTVENSKIDKTDGWATKFINFSIEFIEKECSLSKKSFGSVFKIYFPELYDIIRRLQPDSRGEI